MAIRHLRHKSAVLKGNPCGDPTERDLWIYLPPGYGDERRRYAVLWCLAGFTGTGVNAIGRNQWAPGLPDRLDRLIADGMPPVIVALPDCFTRWGGSQYLNSRALGRYEDYLCDELVPLIDRHFRTVPERAARGVFGKSSGGYGALRLSMTRPDRFAACACHSGDMGFEWCYVPDFARCGARIQAAGSVERWVEQFEKREKKRGADFAAINVFGMAAAYSPDPDAPFGVGLPFDLQTGALREAVWRRWKDHDPVDMVKDPAHADALRALAMLYLDCGSEDEYQLQLGLRQFRRLLEERAIQHVAEEFPDDHRSLNYRYDVSLPLLARALPAG